MKFKKFTFKTTKQKGLASVCSSPYHQIKLNGIPVGRIDHKSLTIFFQVYKKDIMEDGNPNCQWKWINLKQKSKSIAEAKEFIKDFNDEIQQVHDIFIDDRK